VGYKRLSHAVKHFELAITGLEEWKGEFVLRGVAGYNGSPASDGVSGRSAWGDQLTPGKYVLQLRMAFKDK
jgi:hypothetical protein